MDDWIIYRRCTGSIGKQSDLTQEKVNTIVYPLPAAARFNRNRLSRAVKWEEELFLPLLTPRHGVAIRQGAGLQGQAGRAEVQPHTWDQLYARYPRRKDARSSQRCEHWLLPVASLPHTICKKGELE